jgi:hypothetical protein
MRTSPLCNGEACHPNANVFSDTDRLAAEHGEKPNLVSLASSAQISVP